MDPRSELDALCRRHGVPSALGQRLLPLVERAATAPEGVRRRLLGLVEDALAREACELRELDRMHVELDQRLLGAVARVLHPWRGPEDAGPSPLGAEGGTPA